MVKKAGLWECSNCGHHPKGHRDFKFDVPNELGSGMKAKPRYDD